MESPPRIRTHWRQRLGLLVFGLAVVVLLVACAELLLAALGFEGDDRFADPFVGFAASTPVFERAGDGDSAVWRTRAEKLRFFNQQEFLAEKPDGALRVFTLGGSTTAGRPYDDHVSFSRWLERFLDAAEPGRKHEVVNAGAISYASYRVARLMDELLRHEPDLFVVLTGHNEFLEERTYRDVRAQSPWRRWLRSRLARLRLARLAWNAMEADGGDAAPDAARPATLPAEVSTRLEVWNGVQAYSRDDVQRDAVVEHFRFNLRRMVELAESRGVPILFVVPASNVKDFSPFRSQHGDDVPAEKAARIESLLAAAAAEPAGGDAGAVPLQALEEAVATDPLYALAWFRLGRAQLAADHTGSARDSLLEAREQDVAPLRAPSAVVEAVRELAARGVPVIDLPRLLEDEQEARSGHRILGAEHFLDHVHPTLDVHRRIAEEVLAWLAETGLVASPPPSAERDAVYERVLAKLDREYYARRDLNLAKVLGWAGKLEEAEAPLLRAREVLPDEPALHLALGTLWQKQGRHAEAQPELVRAVELLPESPEAHFNLAVVEARLGRLDSAAEHFETALDLRPDYPEAQFNLGLVLRRQGRLDEAVQRLEAARSASPAGDAEARVVVELAATLAERGDLDRARTEIERVLTERPDLAAAHYVRGRLRSGEGDPQGAAESYARALSLDPTHVQSLNSLGILLAGAGRWQEAETYLRRATELDPTYAEAHLNLAVTLDRAGRPADALRSALEAVALRPHDGRIHLAVAMLYLAVGRPEDAKPHLAVAHDAGLQLPPRAAALLAEPAPSS